MARKKDTSLDTAINDMIEESRKIFEKNVLPAIKDVTKSAKSGLTELLKRLDKLEKKVDGLGRKKAPAKKTAARKTAAKKPAARKKAAKKPAARKTAAAKKPAAKK
jgi:hypothetical protein